MKKQLLLLATILSQTLMAQNIGIGTSTPHPNALLHVDLGTSTTNGLLVTGTFDMSSTVPDLGGGTRMMFYPGKGAFRAGTVETAEWDDVNVGFNSFATGANTIASGLYSTAMGYGTTAIGDFSTAMGNYTNAAGNFSTAMGYLANAAGDFSTAMGNYTNAKSGYETVLGTWNTDYTPFDATAWNPADRLFTIGNGTGSSSRSDAITVLKNGNTGIGTSLPDASALLHIELGASTTKGLLVTGTYDTAFTVPDLGAGSRMMFYPGKAAFRAGIVDGTQWDNVNVGAFSFATGLNTIASGLYSTAMGYGSFATSPASTAIGYFTNASGWFSTAMGSLTTASGYSSTALGTATTASGGYSTAMGSNTSAKSAFETVLGTWNTDYTPVNIGDWDPADRLFTIGNGTSSSSTSDAMVVLKNGNTGIGTNSPLAKLHIFNGASGNTSPYSPLVVEGDSDTYINLLSPNANETGIFFGKADNAASGGILYNSIGFPNGLEFLSNGHNVRMVIDNGGWVGIGTGSPAAMLHVNGKSKFTPGGTDIQILAGNNIQAYANGGLNLTTYSDDPIMFCTFTNGNGISNEKMRIASNGNVGIGINSPNAPLAFANSTGKKISLFESSPNSQYGFAVQGAQLQIYSDAAAAKISFGYYSSGTYTERMFLNNSSGVLTVAGTAYPSDARYKKQITRLQDPLEKIMAINGVEYLMRTDEFPSKHFDTKLQVGLIAQEVEKVLPQAVQTGEDGYKAIDYARVVPLLVEGIKEQQHLIEKQQQQIDGLKKLVEKLLKQ